MSSAMDVEERLFSVRTLKTGPDPCFETGSLSRVGLPRGSLIQGCNLTCDPATEAVRVHVLGTREDVVICYVEHDEGRLRMIRRRWVAVFSRVTSTWTVHRPIDFVASAGMAIFRGSVLLTLHDSDPFYTVIRAVDDDFTEILDVEKCQLTSTDLYDFVTKVYDAESHTLYGLVYSQKRFDSSSYRSWEAMLDNIRNRKELRSWSIERSGEVVCGSDTLIVDNAALRFHPVGGWIDSDHLYFLLHDVKTMMDPETQLLRVDRRSHAVDAREVTGPTQFLAFYPLTVVHPYNSSFIVAVHRPDRIDLLKLEQINNKAVISEYREIHVDCQGITAINNITWSPETSSLLMSCSRDVGTFVMELPFQPRRLGALASGVISSLMPCSLRKQLTSLRSNTVTSLLQGIFKDYRMA